MGSGERPSVLAELLQQLKERSGLSYAELARRTHTTRSTLHRYFTGAGIPRDYAVVAAVARECGAEPDELARLGRCWSEALAGSPVPEEAPSQQPPRSRPPGRARAGPRLVMALVLLCTGVILAVTSRSGPPLSLSQRHVPRHGADAGDQWTQYPELVEATGFGVTVNSNTGTMPSFRIGSVRFWDGGTRWADLEPARRSFDWRALDRLVDGAEKAHLSALYTLGGTPAWAAPHGPKTLYADGSRTSAPDRLRDWDAFLRALVTRYHGRIDAYELWDTATDSHFYSGSPRTMAAMVRRAAGIIRSADPKATVVCPSVGRIGARGGSRFLRSFAHFKGFQPCDVIAVKVRRTPARRPPEAMVDDFAVFTAALHRAGVSAPVWETGPDYDVSDQPQLSGQRARDWAVRYFLMSLYERSQHLRRAYFYNWGGTKIPVVLQPEGQAPTSAARAVAQLQKWLRGARIQGCGHGHAAGLPDNAWECRFTHVAAAGGGDAVIQWTEHGTAVMGTDPAETAVHHLDGTTTHTAPGGELLLTEEPVLLTSQTR